MAEFDKNQNAVFDFDEFAELMKNFEPECDDQLILDVFKKCLEECRSHDVNQISYSELTNLVLKYNIGGMGKMFMSDWLIENKPKKVNSNKF